MGLCIELDRGGVIVPTAGSNGEDDTCFLADPARDSEASPPVAVVCEVVREPTSPADRRVRIVSEAGPRVQRVMRECHFAHDDFERTGVTVDHVHCWDGHTNIGSIGLGLDP